MIRACIVEDCQQPHIARGYCQNHYRMFRKHGTPTPQRPTDQDRLMRRVRVDPATGCWHFVGALNTHGYGTMAFRGRQDVAHRIAFTLLRWDIPAGLWVLHTCDIRDCVNPDHLFLGDATANNQDMAAKGRHAHMLKTHCPAGHPYSGENLIHNKRGTKTFRACRTCKKERDEHYRQERHHP